MSNGDVRRLRQRFTDAIDSREPAHESFRAVLGDGLGNVEVPGSPNECYARIEGRSRIEQVTITDVPKINSLPVVCSYTPGNPTVLQVTEIDWTAMPPDVGVMLLQPHHEIHEHLNPDGGYDTVWVAPTQFVEGLGHPTNPLSMQLQVQKFKYPWGTGMNCFPGDWTIDLTPYLPTVGNSRYVLVSVDGATNVLQYTAGTEFPSWPSPNECANLPAVPTGAVSIVYALLVARNNLLTNDAGFTTSGFETPGAGGADIWAYWIENWAGLGNIIDDLVIFYEGAHSCQLVEGGGGRDTDVYQDFNVTPGERYQLRFWTRGDGGANDGAYRVYDVTNAADIIATTGTGQLAAAWAEITAVFTAPAGCTVARVYFYCPAAGASQAWFDAPTVALVTDHLDWPDLLDARFFLEPSYGSLTPTPHDILSIPHPDTAPALVQRGDLMTGQGVVPLWTRHAHPGGAFQLLESTATEWQNAATTSGQTADTVVRVGAVSEIRPKRVAVGAGVNTPNVDGVISLKEIGAAATAIAGQGMLRAGQDADLETKAYWENDVGDEFEMAEIAINVTKTVKLAGGDFTTIQAAIDWFKGRILFGANVIAVDAGTWTTANEVEFSEIIVMPGSSLTLRGDTTHALCGLSYIDGGVCNPTGIANGGTFGAGGGNECVLTINPARTIITVTGALGNPNFAADGWGNNETLIILADNNVVYTRTCTAAAANTLTLNAALPAGATVGLDGSSVGLCPNRRINRNAAGWAVVVTGVYGIYIEGFYITPQAAENGLNVEYGGWCRLNNVLVWVDGGVAAFKTAIQCTQSYAWLQTEEAVSAWEGLYGYMSNNTGFAVLSNSCAVATYVGYIVSSSGMMCPDCIVGSLGALDYGFFCTYGSALAAYRTGVRMNGGGSGWYCLEHSTIIAYLSNARHNVGVPYMGVASCVSAAGSCQSVIRWS